MEQQKPQFRYYYGDESEQFSFFKIPKLLITHEIFRGLSNDAKILYGLLLDRMSLSKKNKWYDEENRAYVVCSIDEITELLNCSRNKAIKSLQELDTDKGIGLIEKRRLGQGNNTIMYQIQMACCRMETGCAICLQGHLLVCIVRNLLTEKQGYLKTNM